MIIYLEPYLAILVLASPGTASIKLVASSEDETFCGVLPCEDDLVEFGVFIELEVILIEAAEAKFGVDLWMEDVLANMDVDRCIEGVLEATFEETFFCRIYWLYAKSQVQFFAVCTVDEYST